MQIFIRNLDSRTLACDVEASACVSELKDAIERQEGIPLHVQGLVYAGKQLQDERTLSSYGVEEHATLVLVLPLRGGKGGFGALLRGLGRDGSKTTNFDACRDLQGRRLRHSEGEKKLQNWQAEAQERELEKAALKHIKEKDRAAKKEQEAQVEVESIVKVQKETVSRVQAAVQDAISAGKVTAGPAPGTKRASQTADPPKAGPAKKPKMLAALETFGSDESDLSESDDE